MKTCINLLVTSIVAAMIVLNGCAPNIIPTASPEIVATTPAPSTAPPTSLPFPSLQTENDLPQTLLVTKPSVDLTDNRIGFVAEAQHIDQRAWAAGIKWMRLVPDPDGRWQHADWEKNEYTVDPNEDRIVDALLANKIKIMLVLDVWHTENRSVYYKSDEDIALYLKWVRYMVNHFKGRIAYYEILNEPDMSFEKPSGMPIDAYVHLVKVTVPVIREEDPDAKIVVGAVPDPLMAGCREWMWELLNSDVMPLVDGVSWHGMYGVTPSDDPRGANNHRPELATDYWEIYPANVEEIKTVAASNGFKGEFMMEEMTWRTAASPGYFNEPTEFTDTAAAKYFARAIIIHLGLDVAPGLAWPPDDVMPISYSIIRALATVMAGVQQPANLPVTIESDATNIRYYGFSLSNGDKLFAVWTDGAAVDDDPGVSATITFPGSSAQSVIGIDVFNGFEQELITENENGNLIIRDLLVKDYPIILRFSGASFAEPDIVEPGIKETPAPFSGEWEGTNPIDGSIVTLSLTQTGDGLTGTYKDTFSPNVEPPGYAGNGSGNTMSDSTAQMTFDLSRWDGETAQLQLFFVLSNQNDTLVVNCDIGCPILMQRK